MQKSRDAIYIGIRGAVLALQRSNGAEIWRADLGGRNFVTVTADGDLILAATKGEVFGLNAANGKVLWHNEMKGRGRGIMTIATPNSPGSSVPSAAQQIADDQAAAAS